MAPSMAVPAPTILRAREELIAIDDAGQRPWLWRRLWMTWTIVDQHASAVPGHLWALGPRVAASRCAAATLAL